jgi:hypothetical protein
LRITESIKSRLAWVSFRTILSAILTKQNPGAEHLSFHRVAIVDPKKCLKINNKPSPAREKFKK